MTEGRCHIETSPLVCSANQWTGFYMITASAMKELRCVTAHDEKKRSCPLNLTITESLFLQSVQSSVAVLLTDLNICKNV